MSRTLTSLVYTLRDEAISSATKRPPPGTPPGPPAARGTRHGSPAAPPVLVGEGARLGQGKLGAARLDHGLATRRWR